MVIISAQPAGGLSLSDGLDLSGLTDLQLWFRYVGIGGCAAPAEVHGFVRKGAEPFEHNLIAHALNEYFLDQHQALPVGYRNSRGGE